MKIKEYVWGTEDWVYEDDNTLIKLIDARESLSVQVHEGGEHWHVIRAAPDGEIICGFNREVSREEFERRIADDTLLEVLNRVKVKQGDYFFIPGGTLHSIGAGVLIAEIRPNDNPTYRVYDYGRGRELHIEKSCEIIYGRAT
jgi:mannose-6-phosphate isomerase